MLSYRPIDALSPVEVYELLKSHGLIPISVPFDMMAEMVRRIAENSQVGMVVDDNENVVASAITFRSEPGVLNFCWIPEVKQLHKRKPELAEMAETLRVDWFKDGIRRVEARVPTSRTQTIRALKGMGFKQETLDTGLRHAVDYGKGWEGLVILGLLESDVMRHLEPITPILVELEVANG